jgi:urease accessory protein
VNAKVSAGEARGWAARLKVEVERHGERSLLARRQHVGPLYVQKPFYPEGPALMHLYLLHPPGGVVGGDRLETVVTLRTGAGALLTTPAAQKLYRSAGLVAELETALALSPGSTLEWLPSETIVFDGARARQRTRVELDAAAAIIGWELTCFGRPASNLRFDSGRLALGLELVRGGEPLLIERVVVEGGSPALAEAWGYAGMPVAGTLYAVGRDDIRSAELLASLRRITAPPGIKSSATALGPALVVRVLGDKLEAVRNLLIECWATLRPAIVGRAACSPRIWAT